MAAAATPPRLGGHLGPVTVISEPSRRRVEEVFRAAASVRRIETIYEEELIRATVLASRPSPPLALRGRRAIPRV